MLRRRHLSGYGIHLRQTAATARFAKRNQRSAERTRDDEARGFERTIPVSGPGRRRAKALRNRQAVERPQLGGYVPGTVETVIHAGDYVLSPSMIARTDA